MIVLEHRRAIHDHETDPHRKLVRLIKRRLIEDRVVVENHKVRRKTFANQTWPMVTRSRDGLFTRASGSKEVAGILTGNCVCSSDQPVTGRNVSFTSLSK